jgi:HAMP domain-containing protein
MRFRGPWTGLRSWQLLLLLGFSVLPVLGVGIVLTRLGETTLTHSVTSDLESLAEARSRAVEAWLEDRPRYVMSALTTALRRQITELLRTGPAGPAAAELREALETVRAAGRFSDLSVVDVATGRTLVSTRPGAVGVVRAESLPFFEMRSLFFGLVRDEGGQHLGFGTLVDDDVGMASAILVGHVDLDFLGEVMAEGSQARGVRLLVLGDGGAVIAGSTPVASGSRVDSAGVRRALSGQTGAGRYADHAGRAVIGAYRPLPRLQLAIVAEVDETTALASVRSLWRGLGVALTIVSLLAVSGALLLSGAITRPVLALTRAAHAIREGDLGHRVDVTAPAELATLATAMNTMAGDLGAAGAARPTWWPRSPATSTRRSTSASCSSGSPRAPAISAAATSVESPSGSRIAT